MRNLLLIVASFAVTIFCWGVYGPVLAKGRTNMALVEGGHALWRPFICVGIAYMVIGIVIPIILLKWRGEKGSFSAAGIAWSLVAGVAGAIGALGILLALEYGGRPVFVMPLVFGGAPVVNAFLTIYMTKRLRDVKPIFLAGLIMVALGAVIVLVFKPEGAARAANETTFKQVALQVTWIVLTIFCWGVYGPLLHKGQEAMQNSRLRPLICVGIAYLVVAVVLPAIILSVHAEASAFRFTGTLWSLAGGAAGALGALGVIMAFNFGGKPVYVMPLIFGGAPIVNSFWTIIATGNAANVHPVFYSGMILVIAGAAIVLVFAPRGKPAATTDAKPVKKDAPHLDEKADTPPAPFDTRAKQPPEDAAERAAAT